MAEKNGAKRHFCDGSISENVHGPKSEHFHISPELTGDNKLNLQIQ